MKTKLLLIHTLSPLHAGTGQGIGAIELPIAREKSTNIPIVPGSSIKGVLKTLSDGETHIEAFGPDTKNASEHAGAVAFGDARLAAIPMRSVSGTFAWVTSPYLLGRIQRDMIAAGTDLPLNKVSVNEGDCLVSSSSQIISKAGNQEKVILEDLDFNCGKTLNEKTVTTLAQLFFNDKDKQEFFSSHLCIVSDTVMSLIMETGTELRTRIAMNPDVKVVKDGALWQEEALPVETLLCAPVYISGSHKKGSSKNAEEISSHIEALFKNNPAIQLGGNASVGQGFCTIKLS